MLGLIGVVIARATLQLNQVGRQQDSAAVSIIALAVSWLSLVGHTYVQEIVVQDNGMTTMTIMTKFSLVAICRTKIWPGSSTSGHR